jgi:hypothetical protein
MPKTYYEKLKDPRWQRKRLEIMESSNFTCSHCGANDQTLNVHHLYYEKNLQPWEYDNRFLKCFCEGCHNTWHEKREAFIRAVAEVESHWGDVEQFYYLATGVVRKDDEALVQGHLSFSWHFLDLQNVEESIDRVINQLELMKMIHKKQSETHELNAK